MPETTHQRDRDVSQTGASPTDGEAPRPGAEHGPAGGGTLPRPSGATLRAAKGRDRDALGTLFDLWFGPVYAIASRLLGDEHLAQDATQEVFLRIHKAIERIDPERDPGPWVTTITYNVCRDHWRRERRRGLGRTASWDDDPHLRERVPSAGEDPEQRVARLEEEKRVQGALMALPDGLRTIVVLHELEGWSHARIAALIGASHAAVRKRYSRALKRLGMTLAESKEGTGTR